MTDKEKPQKYYEAWSDSVIAAQYVRIVLMISLFLNVLLIVVLNRAIHRPPVVIRVDQIGRAEPIADYSVNNRVSKPEALEFVRLFMRDMMERNYLTWKDNLNEANRMITDRLEKDLNANVDWTAEAAAIKEGKLTSVLELSDVSVSRETDKGFVVIVKGFRRITQEDNTVVKEIVFESELVILKVPRTMKTPYGLLVDSYKETPFKQ